MVRVTARSGNPAVRQLLLEHPRVNLQEGPAKASIEFDQEGTTRKVWVDNPNAECFGLLEIIDNNPVVCAQQCSVASPEGTLALIALGPLARAGILLEAPVALFSFEVNPESVERALLSVGWDRGITAEFAEAAEDVLSAVIVSKIATPSSPEELDSLYDGVFGGSFFVRRVEEGPWQAEIVRTEPYAAYRLRYSPGEGESLLTAQVMSAPQGKCGAVQIVHALNVMCGFEESLGLG